MKSITQLFFILMLTIPFSQCMDREDNDDRRYFLRDAFNVMMPTYIYDIGSDLGPDAIGNEQAFEGDASNAYYDALSLPHLNPNLEMQQNDDEYSAVSLYHMLELQLPQELEMMQPMDPMQATEGFDPTQQIQEAQPMDPMQATEGFDPTQQIQEAQPMDPMQATEGFDPTQQIQEAQPMDPMQATEGFDPTQQIQEAQPMDPMQATGGFDPTQQIQEVQPMDPIPPSSNGNDHDTQVGEIKVVSDYNTIEVSRPEGISDDCWNIMMHILSQLAHKDTMLNEAIMRHNYLSKQLQISCSNYMKQDDTLMLQFVTNRRFLKSDRPQKMNAMCWGIIKIVFVEQIKTKRGDILNQVRVARGQ
ncbi:hypothetical protein BdWA1_000299 [Babesia duncani]|uniref:Uncharacterized protein n=1 Tax=Babesia duncani TaxID=323732 RepID=A0AAD9PLY0_9APIC|nr:hypothetical protein BdWA1_000299 [Babesia duncani]